MRALILLSVLVLAGCPQAVPPDKMTEAIQWCNLNGGHMDFHHAGKYDSGSVVGMTCYTPHGSRYFDGERPVTGEVCFQRGRDPEWVKQNPDGSCPAPLSTVGHNQLGLHEATPDAH